MRGAGTFVAMAITTVIVNGLLPSTPLPAQTVEILEDADSFGQDEYASPTLDPTPIPKPSPTPTPVPKIVTLAWDPSPDTTVIGYRLLMGIASHNYVAKITLAKQTSVKVFINHPLTYCVVTAYTADGRESLPTGEVLVIQ